MGFAGTALIIVLLSISTNAARTAQNTNPCSMKCSQPQDSLFRPGQTYTYSYQGESDMKTLNGIYDSTGIMIKSKVKVTGLSSCEMKISMTEVEVLDKLSKDGNTFIKSPNSEKIKRTLEQNEVFFTRENQEVKSICMNKDEPIWSENLKKVIIDNLANNKVHRGNFETRTTSHGTCLQRISPSSNAGYVTVTYDIESCKNKKISQSIFGELTKIGLFHKAQVTCSREYEGRRELKSVKCQEEYKITSFKQNKNQIAVDIKMVLVKESQVETDDKNFPDQHLFKTGIEQSEDDFLSEESTFSSAKLVLKDICGQQVASEFSTIPKLFMKLINLLRNLNTKEFKELYLDVINNNICPQKQSDLKSLFYDATGFVNTPAATSVMVDLIKANQISAYDQNIWLTSLSFMQQTPTIEMLKDLESMLSTTTPNTPMYLGISAVTHLFCKENYQFCLVDITIQNIIAKLLKNLNNDCSLPKDFNQDHLSKVQISLKALGNLKVFNDDVTAVLNKCVSRTKNPVSVRVSALEVMKHMGCEQNRQVAMDVLENNENDSELRINAYLTVMGCPDSNTLFKVRKILENEKVNQVGSFIWTHLTNIKESRDILKVNIRELLDDVKLKKVFDISKLKFSRNIEKTLSSNKLGMTFDSNIIFSEKSFIPRSVSLNTTAMIIDQPSNFIEMSARLEGLDDLLYKLFGPQGYLKKENNAEDNLALIKILNEINGNMNLKLYGQQVSFIELARGSLGSIKKYNIIEELLSWTEDKSIEINKNLQLLDKSAVFPTILGFPLQFKLQSSTSVNIKIKSKLDVTGLFTWPIKMNIENYISPNINAELNADLVLQSPFTKYGMKLNLKSGTNTEFKASIHVSNNEEFSIKFDTPKWKQNLLSVEGNSYVIYRDNELIQLQDKLMKQEICTSELVTNIFGVKACADLKIVSPQFRKDTLLFGPFSANLFIEKQDYQTGYVLRGSSKTVPYIAENGAIYKNRFIKFEFDTPQTKFYDRRYYGEFTLDYKGSYMKLELRNPWNQFSITNTYKLSPNENKIGLNIKLNKKDMVDISAEYLRFLTTKGINYKGGVTVSVLKFQPYTTKWSLDITNKHGVFNFFSTGFLKDDTKIHLKVLKVESTRELSLLNKYQVSGFYNSYFGNGKISGIFNENYFGHRWDIKVNHKPKDISQKEFKLIFRHKVEDKSSKTLMKYFLTTTFAYGEKAENFIKLKTENEMSGKHLRTSMKVSYGQNEDGNSKLVEEIDLELYGGYSTKDQHYEEGSLSFKFPSRNLHYEGRYNAEVGNRVFKVALALDRDQQPQLNLKINYVQPELYLINTNCEITFFIPQHNIELRWNLVEVDVNKYKYSLEGQYNNFDLRIDGVQTQISRFNYDSSLTIKMPHSTHLPKVSNINLKIDLVDLSKSSIYGKIEIPESNFKYTIETEFSYNPQNLFQISSSDISSVVKYDMKLSSSHKTVKSKFIFTCNPEEFQTYFKLSLGENDDSDNQIEFDLHAMHKKPNYKLINDMALLMIRYPGNKHLLSFKSEFKYTEMMAQVDIVWNRDRKISINTMYELDNSWTQKGLRGSVTVKTPFHGFTFTHLGVNAVGQLRYRKVEFEFKYGANKKITFDVIIEPKSSNDFKFSWKLVTPFKGMTLVSFEAKHLTTPRSINTEANLEIGPSSRYQVKFEAINNSDEKNRDYKANILIESGIYPPVKISAIHKDDSTHFKSKFEASWKAVESLTIKSDISYTRDEYDIASNGDVEILSTLFLAKQMKATWLIENRENQFVNNIKIAHNFQNIFNSALKGFYELEHGTFKLDFNGEATLLQERTVKISNVLDFKSSIDINHRFSLSKDSVSLYSHNFVLQEKSVSLKVLIPKVEYRTFELSRTMQIGKAISSFKIGDTNYLSSEEDWSLIRGPDNKMEVKYSVKLRTDYIKVATAEIQLKVKTENRFYSLESEITGNSESVVKLSAELDVRNQNTKCKLAIKTKFEVLKKLNFDLEHLLNPEDGTRTNTLAFSLNERKFNGNLSFRQFKYINMELGLKHRDMEKFLKFKYDHNLMGYEHFFETNIYETKIKLVSSSQLRGGFVVHAKLENCGFFKTLEVLGKFSKDTQLTIIYDQYYRSNEKIKLFYSNSKGIQEFSLDSSTFFNGKIKLDLIEFKTMFLEFQTKATEPKLEFQFKYEGGTHAMKHSSKIMFLSGQDKVEFNNKLEKVTWNYLLMESELNTNWEKLKKFKVGFEYRIQPHRSILDFKGFLNEKFIKLTTNLKGSHLTTEIGLKIETSFAVLKEIDFSLKHEQNTRNTEIKHHCKTIVNSLGTEYKFVNDVELIDFFSWKIESSFMGKTSEEVYLIEPRSLKFLHRLYQHVLTDSLEVLLGKDKNLKVSIKVPFQGNSKMQFQFESFFEQVKRVSVEVDMKISKQFEDAYDVTIERNNERVLFLKVHYKARDRLFFLSSDLELFNSRKTNFKLDFTDYSLGQARVQFKFFDALMTEPMMLDATWNSKISKFSMFIDGTLKEKISTKMELSPSKTFATLVYGSHVFLADIKNQEMKLVRLEMSSVIKAKFELLVSNEAARLSVSFEDNSIAIGHKLEKEIYFNGKVLGKSLELVLKTTNFKQLVFNGKSNFKNWSVFSAELQDKYGPDNEFKWRMFFRREQEEIVNANFIIQLGKSMTIQYSSVYKFMKSGHLKLNYEKAPKEFSLEMNAESFETKFLKASYKINHESFQGNAESSFEWMKEMKINGKFQNKNNEITGTFSLEHNQLEKVFEGGFTLQTKGDLVTLEVKTPFAHPYNEMTFTRLLTRNELLVEWTSNKMKFFSYRARLTDLLMHEIQISIPKSIKFFQFSLKLDVNYKKPTISALLVVKSNLFPEQGLEVFVNFIHSRGKVRYITPSKAIDFEVIISQFKTLGRKIDLIVQHGQEKNSAEFSYDLQTVGNVYLETKVKLSSFISSPLNFEAQYEHKMNFPQNLYLNAQSKINDKIVLLQSINIQRKPDNSVELLGKLILSPHEKEYENKIELFYKDLEKFSLTISSPEILNEQIEILVTKKSENFDISWKSPFELIKSGEFSVRTERRDRSWTKTITFDTNKLGKYEIITTHSRMSTKEFNLSSQLNTPSTNKKIYWKLNLITSHVAQFIKSKLEFDENIFKMKSMIRPNEFSLELSTPFEVLKRCEFIVKPSGLEADILYNDEKFNIKYAQNTELVSLKFQSNWKYFKTMSSSIRVRPSNVLGELIEIELTKDDQSIKMDFQTYIQIYEKTSLMWTLKNDLVPFLPKQFSGKFQYSFTPADIVIDLKTNDVVFFQFILNTNKFLFNARTKGFQTTVTETKILLSKDKIELILLGNSAFSVLITRTSPNQIDCAVMLNENQYSLRTTYEMTRNAVNFKLSTYRNAVEDLFEISNEMDRRGKLIDFKVKLLAKTILKLKLEGSQFPKKISFDVKIFSFNAVADWRMEREPGMVDAKVSWNVLFKNQQLLLGSVELGAKYGRPWKYLLNINFQQMAFQAQLMESENGQFTLQLIGPDKSFDTILKWQYLNKPSEYELLCSLNSNLIGIYSTKVVISLNKDPELKFIFSSESPIIRYNLKMITSNPKELSLKTEFRFLEWEKIAFTGKLSTKDILELSAVLETPFSSVKQIEVKKTINYISFFEHRYETTIIYNGYKKLQYTGVHEIYWSKKIFKLQHSFHREDVKMMSVSIDHSGNHKKLDHSFIWYIKDVKFGYKLNGGFNPMFEGKSEIYTPFHEMGKIVVMGKQMETGVLIETGTNGEKYGSFEYLSERDIRSMRITPPSNYGKPLFVKYRSRRSKRSASDYTEMDVEYGLDSLIKLSTKIQMNQNKYAGFIDIAAPKFSKKSAVLSLDHHYADGSWNFDHNLKIKDSVHTLYRIFGKLFRENARDFKVSLNADHPEFGLMHLSLGHKLTKKSYDNHLIMKSGDLTILDYNNNVKFDFIKSSFTGEWTTKIYSHHYQLNVLHNGERDEFNQNVVMSYNNAPFWQYKGHIVRNQRSVIEMEIPRYDGGKIVVTVDRVKNQAEISWTSKSVNRVVDIMNKNGQFLASYKSGNENVASLLIRYGSQPIYAKANYLQHSGSVEMDFKDSVLTLKAESTFWKMKRAMMEISKNKIISEVNSYDKMYTASAQYEYMGDKFNFIFKSSFKEISSINFQALPNEWTLKVNDYYQTIRYTLKPKHFRLQGENNFFKLKTFAVDLKFKPNENAIAELQLNSFISKTKMEDSKNEWVFQHENNYFSLRTLELKIIQKIKPDVKYYGIVLTANKDQILTLQWDVKNQEYVFGMKTFLGHHAVISFDKKINKMITSVSNKDNHINIIFQLKQDVTQSSKTYTFETRVDSSFDILRELTNELSYTRKNDEYHIQSKSMYNLRSLQLNGQLSRSKVSFYMESDKTIYQITSTLHSANNLVMEIVIPNHKVKIVMKKEKTQYLLDITCNNKDIVIVKVDQDLDLKSGIAHKSRVEYYGRSIWDFSFDSDFKKSEIKMNRPVNIKASVTIVLKESEETVLAFLVQFSETTVMGAGVKYLFTSQSSSYEVHIENYLHIISIRKETKSTTNRLMAWKCVNKINTKQWELKVHSIKDKSLELVWKTPVNQKNIRYRQTIENNVRTMMEFEALDIVKIHLALANPDLWKGYFTLLSKRFASIEIGKGYANAIMNEAAPENERIILKYVISSQGEWKKNYKSIKQLMVVQKALNINFDVFVETKMESGFYSTLTKVKYQLIDGSMKNLKLGATIDFTKYNKVTIKVDNPIFPFKTVLYRFQPDKTTLRYEMRTISWEKNKIDGYIELKTGSNPGMTAKLHYNPEDPTEFFQIHSKYFDDRQMETHVFIEKNEIKTTYFQFLLKLLNEHNIKTTFSMRTDILSGLPRRTFLALEMPLKDFVNFVLSESEWLQVESMLRQIQISELIPTVHYLNSKVRMQVMDTFDEFVLAMQNDEFYIGSIMRLGRDTLNAVFDVIYFCLNNLIYVVERIQSEVFQFVNSIARFIEYKYRELLDQVNYYITIFLHPFQNFCQMISRTYMMNIQNFFAYTMEDVISFSKRGLTNAIMVTRRTRRLISSFFLSNTYRLLKNSIGIIKNTIGKLMEGSLDFLKYEGEIKMVYHEFIGKLQKTSLELRGKLMSVLVAADDHLSFIMGEKYFQNMGKIVSILSDEFIQFLKNEDNQIIVQNAVMSSIGYSVQETIERFRTFTMKLLWPYYVVVDQRIYNGQELKLSLHITSPIPINDFKSLPDFEFLRKKIIRTEFVVNHLKQMGKKFALTMSRFQELAKWFYFTISPMTYPSFLPEFESYATVSKTSIVTFDKKILELNIDQCRILLSKDLQYNKWKIILNQENQQRSYTVIIGENSITISGSDYKVTLNGKPTELPLEIGSTTLVGLGRVMKLQDDNLGLAITIDPLNEIFTVGISGWYHGKVRGLFGNADNEPFNDLMLDNGQIVFDDLFAKSYNDNGQSCNFKVPVKVDLKPVKGCPFLRKLICKFLYKCPWSPLGACFKKVDPENFFNLCINSQEEFQLKYDPSVCNSARQYQSQCLQAGVKISVPAPCQRCDVKNDKPLVVNESRTIKVNNKASDIVFIIDEGHCLNSLKPKLPGFVSDLEKAMNSKGINPVQFGLVTYVGNEKSSASFHTVGQRMLGTRDELLRSIKALSYSKGAHKDVIGGIEQALEYPFSDHSSKHIIMISCQSIHELPASFQTMTDKLKQKGIHFSLLTDFSFKLKDNQMAHVFGVDSKYIYTHSSADVDKGSTTRPVNDFLYQLSMEMKGIVYDYKFLISNQRLTEKKFISSLVTQISLRATPARSAKCTCIEDGEYNCVPLDVYQIFPVKNMS